MCAVDEVVLDGVIVKGIAFVLAITIVCFDDAKVKLNFLCYTE